MVAKVSSRSCPMCSIPKGAPMGYSSFRALDNTRDRHLYAELLEDNIYDADHTQCVHPIRNKFWQYPLCNFYRLWQPDRLHQLLMGLIQDFLHWLLKYVKARNIKNQCDNRFTSVPHYPGLQHFTEPFDRSESGTLQGQEIDGMIRTLAVNCGPILDYSQDTGITAAEIASNQMLVRAVRALCEFSLLVRQQTHSDRSLKALHDELMRFYQKKGIFPEQKFSKYAKAKVDELLACEFHQLCEEIIYTIHAAMKVLVYGAEQVSTTRHRQFQVHLNRAWQAATTWLEADHQMAIEQLEHWIHQVTPSKHKLLYKLSQPHERQLLQKVRTWVIGSWSKLAKDLP